MFVGVEVVWRFAAQERRVWGFEPVYRRPGVPHVPKDADVSARQRGFQEAPQDSNLKCHVPPIAACCARHATQVRHLS